MLQRTHPHEQTIGDTLLVPDNLAEYADPILYNPENGPVEPDGPFLLSLVKRLGGAVLELACGTGRITIPMAENGVGITGLDAVPAMVRRAKQKAQGLPVRWVVADARDYRLGQAFKLIFESGSVFQHMLDRCDQEAFLARVREHLAEGGLFVDGLMFPHTDLLSSVEVEQEWYSYEGPEGQEVRVSGVEGYDPLRQVKLETAFRRWKGTGRWWITLRRCAWSGCATRFLGAAACLVLLFLLIALVMGRPRADEPHWLKAIRFNMWAEYLGQLGYGLWHPRLLFSGSTRAERGAPLPGDGLVPCANARRTRAITIQGAPQDIWPWLVQMGSGRAYWYSWSPGHVYPEYQYQISPDQINPAWQHLRVGDVLLDGSGKEDCSPEKGGWKVIDLQEACYIVLFSARDLVDGIEFDPAKGRPRGAYTVCSWVFFIQPAGERQSRLLVRTRAEIGPKSLGFLIRLVFGNGDTVMQRIMLEGIKKRVERAVEQKRANGRLGARDNQPSKI